jgi:hypothetical protein
MTSLQVQEWLREGMAAAHAGDNGRAYNLFLKVIEVDEYNEQAWLWLSSVVDTDADREVCLENVLAVNPDNKVAKAGLVHLHSKAVQPAPEAQGFELEPPRAPVRTEQRVSSTPVAPWHEAGDVPGAGADGAAEAPQPTAAPAPEQTEAVADWETPESRWRERRERISLEGLAVPALLVLGLLALALALLVLLRAGLLDPERRAYVRAMRPVLEAHEAWWAGPQGALVTELDTLCGPTAGDWRNRDVLQACSQHADVDCAHLAAHCGGDVDAMRAHVADLSQETRQQGQALLEALEGVTPPSDIASAHAHFLACLRAELADAARAGQLAQGYIPSATEMLPPCELFASAEEEIRAYAGIRSARDEQ